jgi:RNase P subunit RPR2
MLKYREEARTAASSDIEQQRPMCLAERMSIRPITYMAVNYPAPVCHRCGLAMLTVTTVHPRTKSEPLKVVSYHCQKCDALCASWADDGAHQ